MNGDHFVDHIFEPSSERQTTGRRKAKIVLHEILPSHGVWQGNGISWDEECIIQNIESVTNMPICAEFLSEERRLPYGHGLTDIKDNMPYMEDVAAVGYYEEGYITDIGIDGETKKVLVDEEHIDEMRYPEFVVWLARKLKNSGMKGSAEIVDYPENDDHIIYDGGWKEHGRIPQIYDYSRYAILDIRPVDDTAIVIELNNKLENSKEETPMDEKIVRQFVELVKTSVTRTITELNNRDEQYEEQILESNGQLVVKDAEITELNEKSTTAQADLTTGDEAMEAQISELNSLKETNVTLEKEKRIIELNSALSKFSTEKQALAQAEIDTFKADSTTIEVNSITGRIYVEMVRKNKGIHNVELSNGVPDILGGAFSPGDKGDVDIFG